MCGTERTLGILCIFMCATFTVLPVVILVLQHKWWSSHGEGEVSHFCGEMQAHLPAALQFLSHHLSSKRRVLIHDTDGEFITISCAAVAQARYPCGLMGDDGLLLG